jgi:hypothetical protein
LSALRSKLCNTPLISAGQGIKKSAFEHVQKCSKNLILAGICFLKLNVPPIPNWIGGTFFCLHSIENFTQ